MKKALPSQDVFHDASDRRAKDGKRKLEMSERMVGMERLVGGGAARPQPLEVSGAVGGHPLRPRASHRDHLAPCRRHSQRLRRLLLLSGPPGTQDRIGRHATFSAPPARLAAAAASPGGHRRHPHQTLRAKGRGSRHSSQPDARPRGPEVSLRTHLGHDLPGPAASVVGRLRCPCGPCSTSGKRPCPRSPGNAIGSSAPSWNWLHAWSGGWRNW